MTTSRPMILLDVDGVCNRLSGPGSEEDWAWEPMFYSTDASGRFPLHLSREMADALFLLGADIHWLTTWDYHANFNIGSHFHWPTLPVLAGPGSPTLNFGMFGTHWKPAAVVKLLRDPGPPVVWIDDDVRYYVDLPYEHALGEGEVLDPHDRLLAVGPAPHAGISKANVAEIQEFLRGRGF
jgi:hypothetical protein